MIHELKTAPTYFIDIANGIKKFEVRKNDRPYAEGDFLALNEYDPKEEYTGRCMLVEVTYILDDPNYCKEGYIVMGINPLSIISSYAKKPVNVYTRRDKA